MKTPRELLLGHHRQAEQKLEALSRAVLSELKNEPAKPARLMDSCLRWPQNFWREVIWPARRIWTGLAAVWAVILVANVDFHAYAPQISATSSPNALGYVIALREQEQWMAAFSEKPQPVKAQPPKPRLPQPRTELRGQFFMI